MKVGTTPNVSFGSKYLMEIDNPKTKNLLKTSR
jgi:hypothetical protein